MPAHVKIRQTDSNCRVQQKQGKRQNESEIDVIEICSKNEYEFKL